MDDFVTEAKFAIWVRDSIAFTEIKSPFIEKEIETIAIALPAFKLTVTNVYRGFGNSEAAITKLTDLVDKFKDGYDKAIVGDLNIDLLTDSKYSDILSTAMADRGFCQIINMPTRTTCNSITLIDHSYVKTKKVTTSAITTADISDHSVTLTFSDKVQVESKKQKVSKRWLTNEDYMHIKLFLREEKWGTLHKMDINTATSYLIDKINEIMDIFSPVETKEMSTRPINQWKTQGIAISLKSANKQYRQYSKDKSNIALEESYKQYRNILNKVIRKSKDSYYSARITSAGTDGRQIWSIINEVVDRKKSKHKMPNSFKVKDEIISGDKNIANAFNQYFTSIGTDMANSLPSEDSFQEFLSFYTEDVFHIQQVEQERVSKIMAGPETQA